MYRPTKAHLPHLNQEYDSYLDDHPIYSKIGGWVCDKDTGDLKYKLHKLDWIKKSDGTPSVLTGEDGDVMVMIPAFAFKINLDTGFFELDSTIPNRDASNIEDGFRVHPAFVKDDGTIKPYFLIGAFPATEINNQLRSVSGPFKNPGFTISMSISKAQQGRNTGSNFYLITRLYERAALHMLYEFDFATRNSQSVLGMGIRYYDYLTCGNTNSLGDRSGYIGENKKSVIRWRGIEGIFGCINERIGGVVISKDGFYFKHSNIGSQTNHTEMRFIPNILRNDTSFYPKKTIKVDEDAWLMMILDYSQESNSTSLSSYYFCDDSYLSFSVENQVFSVGGNDSYSSYGMYYQSIRDKFNDAGGSNGSRLTCSEN